MRSGPEAVVALTDSEKDTIVQKFAACPFVGSAISQGDLAVRNTPRDPLASVEDLRKLGDSGGGDLGHVLVLFATGNHAFMRGESGRLDIRTPNGLFSLEFPGSQGAHPGHSAILMGDPAIPGSGRFSAADFARLTDRAKDGLIKLSDVGAFIAENLRRDPKAKVADVDVAAALARDLLAVGASLLPTLIGKLGGDPDMADMALRTFFERFTKLAGEDNLIGSSGEFGLLFAFLANKPGARIVDGEPTIAVDDLQAMFLRKMLPAGFETWKKSATDWMRGTLALAVSAAKEFHRPSRTPDPPGA